MQSFIKSIKQLLEKEIPRSSRVFIVGHNSPDFDSIASAIALATLAKSMGREAYIVLDENPEKIEPGVKKIIDQAKRTYKFIRKEEFLKLADKKSLLLVTDVNKKNMISIGDNLDSVSKVVVIDHHSEDGNTIDTPYKYIRMDSSSASEIVAMVLSQCKVRYTEKVANYLLAGISLDTKRFKQNTSAFTHDVAEHLMIHGASMDTVQQFFNEDYDSFCRISKLIIYDTNIEDYLGPAFSSAKVSYTLNKEEPKTLYQREDMAKAADRMLKFQGIDASFALGYISPTEVHISARSNKRIDVGSIMTSIGGGGTPQTAAALIQTDNIFELEERLKQAVDRVLVKYRKE